MVGSDRRIEGVNGVPVANVRRAVDWFRSAMSSNYSSPEYFATHVTCGAKIASRAANG